MVGWLVGFMVFNATFNTISVISWQSVLLVEEPEYPEKKVKNDNKSFKYNPIKMSL